MRTARRPRQTCARFGIGVRWDMYNRRRIGRVGFWAPALLWLPFGVFVTAAVLFWTAPAAWTPMMPASAIAAVCRAGCPSPWLAGGYGGWVGAAPPGRCGRGSER